MKEFVSYSRSLAPLSRGGKLVSGKMSDPTTARKARRRLKAIRKKKGYL